MFRPILISLLFLVFSWTASAANFPRPQSLEPAVRFWTDVYTKVSTNQGYIHDDTRLDVVYETLDLPPYASNHSRQNMVDKAKQRVAGALANLAAGKRTGLSDTEARVLKAWPEGTTNAEFREARSRVRFQLGQSNRFKEGLIRSGRWKPHIRRVLAMHQLPQELEVLPHVESSFNPSAYSKVAAAGMWQFMPATARQYMRVDHIIDERMDPYIATEGAIRLLKRNHEILGNWPLALTAYNFGAGGLLRATKSLGTSDIGVIAAKYKGPAFGFASRNFYPSFLAALEVDRNAERYFGPLALDKPHDYETVVLDDYIPALALANRLQVPLADLKTFNPSLLETVWTGEKYIPRGFEVRLPRGHRGQPLSTALAALSTSERYSAQKPDVLHRIRSGESLSVIASRYDTTVSKLMALNGLRSHMIRAGQTLKLPGNNTSAAPERVASAAPKPDGSGSPGSGEYVIQPGDSLWSISRRFNISQQELVLWNSITDKHQIHPGQTLKVAGEGVTAEYIIQPGDSLWAIAQRFNVSHRDLMAWNNLQKGHLIKPGQVLRLASN